MTSGIPPSDRPHPDVATSNNPLTGDNTLSTTYDESRGRAVERPTPAPSAEPSGSSADDVDALKDGAAAAKDKAADAAQAGKQAAAKVADTAVDAAKDVAEQTQTQAKNLLDKTRDELNTQAAAQQSSLVTTLRDLGDQFATMADTDKDGAAIQLVADARDRTRDAADWLDRRDPGQVLEELRELGRRRPGAFLLGSAVAGILAGRLSRGVAAVHSDDRTSPEQSGEPGAHRQVGA